MLAAKISVLVLTQNSQTTLRRCLESLKFFDEVVIIDGGSTDDTIKIAQQFQNVNIFKNPWPGFIAQRNFSIKCATHPWCLMVDSDEAVTPELAKKIYQTIKSKNTKVLYKIMRSEYYLGKIIEYGHGKSSYQERLFQKDRVKYTGGNHHSHLIDDKPKKLKKHLIGYFTRNFRILHDSNYSLDDWIKKLPRFSLLVGEEKTTLGKTCGTLSVLWILFSSFFKVFFRHFINGRIGFVISVQEAVYRTLVQLYIYERSNINFKKKNSFIKDNLG